jgi:hypothetical protein
MVITVAIAFLAVCVVVSTLVLLGVFKTEKEKSVADATTNYGVTAPCVADKAEALAYTSITVRVLNGTNKSGIARALSKALNNRGFKLQSVGDFTTDNLARTEIRFGKNGITQAYTVYSQFTDAVLRMDDRTDKLVDVVVGSTFSDIVDEDEVTPAVSGKLSNFTGCVQASTMKDLPKAIKHTAVK